MHAQKCDADKEYQEDEEEDVEDVEVEKIIIKLKCFVSQGDFSI